MRVVSMFGLAVATGALLFVAGCGGHHQGCPASSPSCGPECAGHGRGDRGDRGDRNRGERDDSDRGDHERGDRGDRERGDRGDRERGDRGDRGWDGPDRGDHSCGGPGRGDRDGGPGRGWGGPPPEAFEVCSGKKAGDACVLKRDAWEMKGNCIASRRPEGDGPLVCAPPHPAAPGASAEVPKTPPPAAPKPR